MMEQSEYPPLRMKPYFSTPINEIPVDYLIWIFPKLKRSVKFLQVFTSILEYFLSKEISVIDQTKESAGYGFYFNDHRRFEPGSGEEIPFMKSKWKGYDSKGKEVYEIKHLSNRIYIQEKETKWFINRNIVSFNYYFGGDHLVYEKTNKYYFIDGYKRIFNNAYLLREPWVPNENDINFSKNIKNE